MDATVIVSKYTVQVPKCQKRLNLVFATEAISHTIVYCLKTFAN